MVNLLDSVIYETYNTKWNFQTKTNSSLPENSQRYARQSPLDSPNSRKAASLHSDHLKIDRDWSSLITIWTLKEKLDKILETRKEEFEIGLRKERKSSTTDFCKSLSWLCIAKLQGSKVFGTKSINGGTIGFFYRKQPIYTNNEFQIGKTQLRKSIPSFSSWKLDMRNAIPWNAVCRTFLEFFPL